MPRIPLSSAILEAALNGEGEFDLDAETAKKLVRVLRLGPGEVFTGFDGQGREWECALTEVESSGRPRARAVIVGERDALRLPRLRLAIAQAVPKGDKMDLVLQKGTELGASEFYPFESERSVSRLSFEDQAERASARAARWRKIVEAACAQCGRADVPYVHALSDLSTVVSSGTALGRCLMLDESPEARPLRVALSEDPVEWDEDAPPQLMLLIGPEGGWSEREREWALRYGAEPVSLGARVLRTETAALVATTILMWEAGDL